jgi:hypothetical protein
MKKYKTSEAIAMLGKNPELQFEGIGKKARLSIGKLGYIHYVSHVLSNNLSDNVKPEDEWELIQQPVPFMEAVKAYSEGKTIRCESQNYNTRTYKPNGTDKLIDQHRIAITTHEIINGTWYVEDNNE